MHARVVLGVGRGVLFREVSSVQESLYSIEFDVQFVFGKLQHCHAMSAFLDSQGRKFGHAWLAPI